MNKYYVILEFPRDTSANQGQVEFVEMEASSEAEAIEKAKQSVLHLIKVNKVRIVETASILNKGATVDKEGALTHGEPCVVESWDESAKKYKVLFDNGFCGWYKSLELIIDSN